MLKKRIFGMIKIAILIMGAFQAQGQGMAINTTGNPADASAMLDVNSTSQGVLVPRMTTSQRTGISAPAQGLLVFDVTAGGFYYYNSGWASLNMPHGCQTYSSTGVVATFTVPAGVTSITVTAVGGGGGSTAGNAAAAGLGGYGASITGTLTVTQGEVLDILVGGHGAYSNSGDAGGGGGGTFVWNAAGNTLLVCAGGGGGGGSAYNSTDAPGGNGQTSNTSAATLETGTNGTGGNGAAGTGGAGSSAGAQGTGGGNNGVGCGGAGWGQSSTAISSGTYQPVGAGITPSSGGGGGLGYNGGVSNGIAGNGGHGGGGGGGYAGGGGGGGYNGGGGGTAGIGGSNGGGGGGGGSYFNATVATSTSIATDRDGLGSVTITW